ncbi:hypothetical protein AC804_05180 [Chryseobacterium sp. Hurlbut01]|nr:hypothetical protein AC804_05180 [Chryseobacterium sp. Hurlbut01]
MKTLSLIGILVSILGIIISFAIIDNHNDFYRELYQVLDLSYEDLETLSPKQKVYNTTSILDTGTNMCFVLMSLFGFFLFTSIKIYRDER